MGRSPAQPNCPKVSTSPGCRPCSRPVSSGYDGKGAGQITKGGDPVAAWRSLHNAPCIVEGFIDFEREVSVVAARSRDGKVECFEVTENFYCDHILSLAACPRRSRRPCRARRASRHPHRQGLRLCRRIGRRNVRGAQRRRAIAPGQRDAPRVHNSGHWTIDGATVSQFEQHMRAVAGLAAGKAHAARQPRRNDEPDRSGNRTRRRAG